VKTTVGVEGELVAEIDHRMDQGLRLAFRRIDPERGGY
jgi:hypothetical protein